MQFTNIIPGSAISLFVKNIMVFEETQRSLKTVLPFFADGYPGLMFQEAANGLWVQPHNKKMPTTFLYGQTINPIELHIEGWYKIIVFQLYPFVINSFFNINAKDINDDCYDLLQIEQWKMFERKIVENGDRQKRVAFLTDFLLALFIAKKQSLDFAIGQGIQFVLDNKAQVTINQLCKKLNLTERTFERRFLKEVGITARHFIQIIKFQQSLEQLSVKEFTKLTDIVYNNGYADQSHFIRVFKAFTGKTPKAFLKSQKM